MHSILLAVLLVSGVGIVAGLLLGVASKVFAVPVDQKAEDLSEMLPGANCGGCGYSGCSGYAAALAGGKITDCAKCVAGGDEVARQLADYLGLSADSAAKTCAVVLCRGNTENTELKMEYRGEMSCAAAAKLYGGPKSCSYSCVGYGDCMKACPFDAISICRGVAVIDPAKCKSCGKCVAACPKQVIEILPAETAKAVVLCKNTDKGAAAKKACKTACIGCGKCMKACDCGAVKVSNFCASVDRAQCTACGKCAEACPDGCIILR